MPTLESKPSLSLWYVWFTSATVVFLKACYVLLVPMRGLASTSWLIDDSFIEMRVAKNIAMGLGFTLDGVHSTTGAPFLWIYLSSLNHMLFGADMAIRATLIMTSVIGALCAVAVFYIAQKLTQDKRVAWTAFILATFTGNAFLNGMNGMDTVLFTLFVLLSIGTYLGVGRPANWSNFAWGTVIGLMLGLTCLTRGDGIFVLFALFCVQAYSWWKAQGTERKEQGKLLLGMLLLWGVCFAAFMTWQLVQTGSPFPGNQVGRRELSLAWHQFDFAQFDLYRYLKISGWNIFQLEELFTIATGSSFFMLAALVYGTLKKELRTLGVISFLYFGTFFALLVGYQWYFANLHGLRYINPATHILFIFVAYLLWQIPVDKLKRTAVVFLAICLIVLSGYKYYQMTTRFPWARYMGFFSNPDPVESEKFWHAIDWVKTNLPPGTIVGARDYGRISLFTDVRLQDIAGNIDPLANEALNNGTLAQYLKDKKVEYLFIPGIEQRPDKLYQYIYTKMAKNLVLQKEASKYMEMTRLYKLVW